MLFSRQFAAIPRPVGLSITRATTARCGALSFPNPTARLSQNRTLYSVTRWEERGVEKYGDKWRANLSPGKLLRVTRREEHRQAWLEETKAAHGDNWEAVVKQADDDELAARRTRRKPQLQTETETEAHEAPKRKNRIEERKAKVARKHALKTAKSQVTQEQRQKKRESNTAKFIAKLKDKHGEKWEDHLVKLRQRRKNGDKDAATPEALEDMA